MALDYNYVAEYDQYLYQSELTNLLSIGTHRLCARIVDTNDVTHFRSPAFTLTVNPIFTYRPDNGNAILTGFYGNTSSLEIPAVWDGFPVVGIASNFFANSNVRQILLPDSITNIETGAFGGNPGLELFFFTGNAPAADNSLLSGTAINVLYLPGKTGWTSTFGGRPALAWNPAVATGSIGFSQSLFGFTIEGTPQIPVHVQTSTNIITGIWQTLTNAVLNGNGEIKIADPSSTTELIRFYRFVWP
jgi:hypothetical protein